MFTGSIDYELYRSGGTHREGFRRISFMISRISGQSEVYQF
jgi:hypothetical protein